ncbi:MAG: hypothetical protein KAR20_26510, partial [Candidatus Heimdallarchaeota archaeon]|nr:hypothetical protein [Candidatus Heimdallarchaeota archaeon]
SKNKSDSWLSFMRVHFIETTGGEEDPMGDKMFELPLLIIFLGYLTLIGASAIYLNNIGPVFWPMYFLGILIFDGLSIIFCRKVHVGLSICSYFLGKWCYGAVWGEVLLFLLKVTSVSKSQLNGYILLFGITTLSSLGETKVLDHFTPSHKRDLSKYKYFFTLAIHIILGFIFGKSFIVFLVVTFLYVFLLNDLIAEIALLVKKDHFMAAVANITIFYYTAIPYLIFYIFGWILRF